MPTQDDINLIVEIILGRRSVRAGDRLVQELGAESMDIANIARLVEERYGVFIPEERLGDLQTPADILSFVKHEFHG
jgi:acyl carrier protein